MSKYRTMTREERLNFEKKSFKINEVTTITECHSGWWLWDENRRINLSMKADSKEDALIEAFEYYQKNFKEMEKNYYLLKNKVDSFVGQFIVEEEY